MTTRDEDTRRSNAHVQAMKALDQYLRIIHNFSNIDQLAEAYEQVPEATKKGRTLTQMAADDLMDAFAFVTMNVQESDIPQDYFKRLMGARNPGVRAPDDAAVMRTLRERTAKIRAAYAKDAKNLKALPDFISLTMDKVDTILTQNMVRHWTTNINHIGRLMLPEGALAVEENSGILIKKFYEATAAIKTGGTGAGATALPPRLKTMLSTIGEDLVELARAGALSDTDGREKEASKVFRVLMHKNTTPAMIHGAEGVGKSAVVNAMASMIVDGTAPSRMRNAHIYKISLANMLFAGNADLKTVLREVAEHNRKNEDQVILHFSDYGFCPDPTLPLRQGMGMMRNLIVHEAQNTKGLRISSEATKQDLFVLEKQDANALKNMQRIEVESLPIADTKTLIKKQSVEYGNVSNVNIPDDMVDYIIRKTDRFMPNQHRPGKVQTVIQDAVALCEIKGEKKLTESAIDEVISDATRLPLTFIGSSMSDSIEHLEEALLTQIFGQDHAIKMVADTVKLVNQNLNDPKKPLGVFYGIGPTGVGKTELAKALARSLFKDEKALITVNLSDFAEKHTVSRILGAPPGYVGYGEKTALEDVADRPFSVVLFDEAEKAHGDVDNALMKVMDEGQLTLLNGKQIDFRNCVLIFSSNLGASAAEEARGRKRASFHSQHGSENELDAKKAVQEAMKARLKPEFRNRATFIDFNALTAPVVSMITDKKIREVSERLRENKAYKNLTVTLAPRAKEELMKIGFQPESGARPMERAITQNVLVPLGEWLSKKQADGTAAGWLSGQFEVRINNLKDFDVEVFQVNRPQPPAASVPAVA